MSSFVDTLTDPVLFWTKSWRDHLARTTSMSGLTSLEMLKKRAREKLSKVDRERLALGLHVETMRLKSAATLPRPFSGAEWMPAAGLASEPANASKRMNEYVLTPYGQTNRPAWDPEGWELRVSHLSASVRDFAALIEALLRFTDESPEQICHRIFTGTSFATTTAESQRCERLAARLDALVAQTDKLVDRVSPGAGLTALFTRTAQVKESMLRAGSASAWWPYPNRDEPVSIGVLPAPYWDLAYDQAHVTLDPVDPRYRYMSCPPLDWFNALLYLPRAYLGCVTYVPSWVTTPDPAAEDVGQLMATLYESQSTLTEVRTLATGDARIRAPGDRRDDPCASRMAPTLDANYRFPEEEGHCWLVIYPAQSGKGLSALLYWSLGEGGVHVCSLDRHSMHVASQLHLPGEYGVMTVVERIEQLLDDPRHSLAQEWARTAFDLQNNPVLAAQRLHR